MFKKIVSIMLAFVCIFSLCSLGISASAGSPSTGTTETQRSSQTKAISVSYGYDALLSKWNTTQASCKMKYAYYSPVLQAPFEDNTKYPLVIYVHGLFHGWTDSSFVKSGLTYWACSEMQDKFKEGGAFLLAPKIPEVVPTASQKDNVMSVIKEFIAKNADHIDTNQIYIMGGSAGGGLAFNLLIDNPEFFTKGILLCATGSVTAKEAKKIANIPVWMISANTDPLVNILLQKAIWNNVSGQSKVKDQCRWTRFTNRVTLPDGTHPGISHFLAKTIGYNLCTISNQNVFPDMNTVNGYGSCVSLSWQNSLVEWLQT